MFSKGPPDRKPHIEDRRTKLNKGKKEAQTFHNSGKIGHQGKDCWRKGISKNPQLKNAKYAKRLAVPKKLAGQNIKRRQPLLRDARHTKVGTGTNETSCDAAAAVTRASKRTETKRLRPPDQVDLGLSVEELKEMQKEDPSLEQARKFARIGDVIHTGKQNQCWYSYPKVFWGAYETLQIPQRRTR
ncbi:hypothetical protein RRG08_003812 [Elysia crispata]|uniref:Uncharacterized protein n=1 Tax=Elysia crispata TaxID=231223 RepID=A0AAE1BCS8_9GAST|nr:hypothetical protein RRG08_003812 [Elysia crispata]